MPVRRMLTRQAVKKHQAVSGNNIEGKRDTSEDGSDKSNIEGGDLVTKWEDCAVVEEEISHEEGGNDEIIKSPPVPAAKLVNKYDAALNWIDNTGQHYWQGTSVLQYKRMVKIPNITLMRDIKLTKEGKVIKVNKGKGRPSV